MNKMLNKLPTFILNEIQMYLQEDYICAYLYELDHNIIRYNFTEWVNYLEKCEKFPLKFRISDNSERQWMSLQSEKLKYCKQFWINVIPLRHTCIDTYIEKYDLSGFFERLEYLDMNLVCTKEIKKYDFLKKMKNLKYLYCRGRGLEEIPEELSNLVLLDCSFNNIKKLPKRMPHLRSLNCKHNKLEELPEMPNIEELYCADNNIKNIPIGFHKIKTLNCCFNPLKKLPEGMNNLQRIDLFATAIGFDHPYTCVNIYKFKDMW